MIKSYVLCAAADQLRPETLTHEQALN